MKKCKDCNKLINEIATRCQSCANKGKNNPNFGKHLMGKLASHFINGETLKQYFCVCGKEISYQSGLYGSGLCGSCSCKERLKDPKNHPSFGKKINVGRNNPMFGKTAGWHWKKYKQIGFRSSWEVAYAKYLDKNKIKWLYELKVFDLGDTTYTPDFYLPETNEYIEIKGYWYRDTYKKFKKFKKQYSKIKIKLLMEKDLKVLQIIK